MMVYMKVYYKVLETVDAYSMNVMVFVLAYIIRQIISVKPCQCKVKQERCHQ